MPVNDGDRLPTQPRSSRHIGVDDQARKVAPLIALASLSAVGADKPGGAATQPGGPAPELVSFPRGGATLQGWIYKPAGAGPFPAVLYNHGSDKVPGWFPTLGAFWTGHGYVFFVPHRAGHGRSPGDYIVDE